MESSNLKIAPIFKLYQPVTLLDRRLARGPGDLGFSYILESEKGLQRIVECLREAVEVGVSPQKASMNLHRVRYTYWLPEVPHE